MPPEDPPATPFPDAALELGAIRSNVRAARRVDSERRAHILLAHLTAGFVSIVALLALIGWAINSDWLKGLNHPAHIAMNPATAVAFLLCGGAMHLLVRSPVRRRRFIADCLAAAALAIGIVQLLAAAGLPVRIDEFLFRSRLAGSTMPANVALTFILNGAALLLLDRPVRRVRLAPWLMLVSLAVSLLTLLAYAYDISSLYGNTSPIRAALNTAICAYALSLAVLASRPQHPPLSTVLSDTAGGLIARRLLPTAVLMPAIAGSVALWIVRQGGIGPELAVLLFTVATIVVFVALTSWTADRLHRLDLSNRRTVERLQSAEAVYHSLVETLPQNIFRKDTEGRFTFGNRNFCATLGRSLDDLVGRTDFDFYSPALAASYRDDDLKVASGVSRDAVEEHITPAGDRLYVQVIKTPVRGVDGNIIGVQGIFWNVTDRVVAQRQLEEKNSELVLANERLAQFNSQLEQANERLEQAVASERAAIEQVRKTQLHLVQSEKMVGLGQMVAGVAHEINNPLAFVSNNVAVLQRDVAALAKLIDLFRQAEDVIRDGNPALAEEIRELAEMIDLDYTRHNLDDLLARSREGLRRIQQIVRDLRDFVRLDESDLQDTDLNVGVASTVNIISGHGKKRQVKIEVDLDPLPLISCFPAKINQVIMNLVSNAIDASHDEGVVTIRTKADCDAGVLLEVSDDGCGIAPDVLARIFDPFFTTKPIGQGTGLGLSISYGIVRDHGGTIDVQSEIGKGTRFIVRLPLRCVQLAVKIRQILAFRHDPESPMLVVVAEQPG